MAADRDPWYTRLADALVGLFSPRRVLERRRLRALTRSGYKNAKHPLSGVPWRGSPFGLEPDGEVLFDLPTLRGRSREVNRDDPIGSGLTRHFVRKVVGTGLRPQSRTMGNGSRELNAAIEAAFDDLADTLCPADNLPYGAVQRLRYTKFLEDGEVFVVATLRGDRVVTETIEGDRVDTPTDARPADKEGEIRAGVERDRFGGARRLLDSEAPPAERHDRRQPRPDHAHQLPHDGLVGLRSGAG